MSYEIHVTLDPKYRHQAEVLAKEFHWKTSEIEGDPVLGQASYFYLTTHFTYLNPAVVDLARIRAALQEVRVPIIREKIERIVYDTKTGVDKEDVEALLLSCAEGLFSENARVRTQRAIRNQSIPVPQTVKPIDLYFQANLPEPTINS